MNVVHRDATGIEERRDDQRGVEVAAQRFGERIGFRRVSE
jgi:hypothetical protein